jgi:hypothetical protein
VLFNVWAERLFHWKNVGVRPFTHVPVLILRGPYRVTRNPMYVGLVCLNLSVTFFSGALANIWSSVAFHLAALRIRSSRGGLSPPRTRQYIRRICPSCSAVAFHATIEVNRNRDEFTDCECRSACIRFRRPPVRSDGTARGLSRVRFLLHRRTRS